MNGLLYPRWIFSVVGILTLCFLLSSCFFRVQEDYPSYEGSLVSIDKDKCPDISGIYRNTYTFGKGNYKLSKILGFKNKIGETHMKIIQLDDGTFETSGLDMAGDEQKLVYKNSYGRKKFSCTPEGLRTSSHTEVHFPSRFPGLAVMFGSFYLTKNTNGSLVAKDKGTVFGLLGILLLLPVIGSGSDWYIFPYEDLKEE